MGRRWGGRIPGLQDDYNDTEPVGSPDTAREHPEGCVGSHSLSPAQPRALGRILHINFCVVETEGSEEGEQLAQVLKLVMVEL